MSNDTLTVADRIAMLVGGGLMILGIVVLGFINTILGAPTTVVMEDGQIVAEPAISPEIRAMIVALGLLVWLGYVVYKLFSTPSSEVEGHPTAVES